MPIVKLTDRFIAAITPTSTRIEFHDTHTRGLSLRVTEQGAKSWSLRYRHRGRMRRLTLGSLDALTLAQARQRARDELYAVSKGEDVASVKQDTKTANTVAELADDYITKYAQPKKKSWKTDRQRLDRHVLPAWKHRAAVDITRADVLQLVDHVAEHSGPIEANRLVALLSKVFAYALDRQIVTASPAVKIAKPGAEHSRDRVLDADEIRRLWTSWGDGDVFTDYFKLELLTLQRGQEVRDLRWQDLDADLTWWTVPSTSAKNRLSHRVFLGTTAASIIAARLATATAQDVYVLSGARGRRQMYDAVADWPVTNATPHDLRRTAATLMTSGGITRFIVGKILNHIEPGVTKVYDRSAYDAEKTAAVRWWDLKLASILANRPFIALPFARVAV